MDSQGSDCGYQMKITRQSSAGQNAIFELDVLYRHEMFSQMQPRTSGLLLLLLTKQAKRFENA